MPLFDRKDKSRYATFTRRSLLVSGGMTAVFGVLTARLYQLQIVEGDLYMTRAEDNRVNLRLLPPPRGRIFDRFGIELATNRRNYRALVVAEQVSGNVEGVLDALAKIIPLNDRDRARVLKDVAVNKSFVPVPVAENLTWDEFARVNLDLPYLPGVQPDIGETRDYPFLDEMSHVLGYVAVVSPEDQADDDDPLLSVPGFRIGKRGVEKAFDPEIRGHGGASRVEVNAYGRVIRELAREPGQAGEDVYLTVDRELQHFVSERLKGESAACVVMDTRSGDVLALVSTPGYDPNKFNVGITPDEWQALMDDDHKPLLNKVLSGLYPPGSTFKTVTGLTALDQHAITTDFSLTCTGKTTLGTHEFHCWKKDGHGHVDFHLGLKYSCDIYFYEVARRLGIDKLAAGARKLGLGEFGGIEIPGERNGFVPTRDWKQATYGQPWQQGETLITGIGQGYVLTTPLQLCMLAARLASGRQVVPRLAHSLGATALPRLLPEPLDVSPDALAAVQAGMNGVSNEGDGTAYSARITVPGFELAGKTGTSQVRRISAEERLAGVRKNESLPWNLRDHALFLAFAPVSAPRYAISVVVEHGGSGAHAAAPVARDILLFAQQRDLLNLPVAYPVRAASAAPSL